MATRPTSKAACGSIVSYGLSLAKTKRLCATAAGGIAASSASMTTSSSEKRRVIISGLQRFCKRRAPCDVAGLYGRAVRVGKRPAATVVLPGQDPPCDLRDYRFLDSVVTVVGPGLARVTAAHAARDRDQLLPR